MNKDFNKLFREARKTIPYKETTIYLRFSGEVYKKMQSYKVSRAWLASKLNIPRGKLNGLLDDTLPFDIHNMLLICKELDITMSVRFYPLNKPK